LSNLDGALYGTPAMNSLHGYARNTLGPMLGQLGWSVAPSDTAVELRLRNDLIEALGTFGDEATLRKSMELFNAERNGGAAIDPSIRPGVMANVARRADAAVFAELVRRMTTAVRVEDGWLYASALAYLEDPALARQFLDLTLGDAMPPQLVTWVPGMVAGNYRHAAMTYAFVLGNFAALSSKITEQGRPYLLPRAASGFNESARATALIADQRRLVGDPGEKTANETAADIELKSRIAARNVASLARADRPSRAKPR
jgi:hypothetical protein